MTPDDIRGALALALPVWVERVDVEFADDAEGRPATFLRVIVKKGHPEVFEDGALLVDTRWVIRNALPLAEWPYIDFIASEEV